MKDSYSNFACNINIRISPEQYKKIKESGMKLSEFVREKLDEEFETSESIAEKETELTKQLEKIQVIKERVKNRVPKEIKNTPEREKKFLEETKKLLKDRPEWFTGRWNLYKNEFGKTITKEQFQELVQ